MTYVGGAIVSLRGNCSFCEKAHYAESANASLLVIVYNDSDIVSCYIWSLVCCHIYSMQLVDPVCGRGDPTPSIPVLLVANESGWEILNALLLTNLTLTPFTPPSMPFDPAAIVTLLIAVVTVMLGSYLANTPFDFLRLVLSPVIEGQGFQVSSLLSGMACWSGGERDMDCQRHQRRPVGRRQLP